MNTIFLLTVIPVLAYFTGRGAIAAIMNIYKEVGFTDKPNGRKMHKDPVPAAGGIGIIFTIALIIATVPFLGHFVNAHIDVAMACITLGIVGAIDDKANLPATLRLMVQVACAFAIAHSGIRLYSLYGFLGVEHIPVYMQYIITTIIITGITNAFNLLDGLDGLLGSVALVNVLTLAAMAYFTQHYYLAIALAVIGGGLTAFLSYNWNPARLFMGDSGSLFLGFLMAAVAIFLLIDYPVSAAPHHNYNPLVTLVTAMFIMPVADTLRVFSTRIKAGRSPFSADKTHLHHKLVKQVRSHKAATKKIITVHVAILVLTALLQHVVSISAMILLQMLFIIYYTKIVDMFTSFFKWNRAIKKLELSNN